MHRRFCDSYRMVQRHYLLGQISQLNALDECIDIWLRTSKQGNIIHKSTKTQNWAISLVMQNISNARGLFEPQ